MSGNDFYEEDEPIEDIMRAFNAGPRSVTAWSPTTRGGPPAGVPTWVDESGTCTLYLPGCDTTQPPTFGGRPMRRIA